MDRAAISAKGVDSPATILAFCISAVLLAIVSGAPKGS